MRAAVPDPLYLPDAEIAKRVSMSPSDWQATALVLERSGLPRRDPLFNNQRCWWKVQDFLYRRAGGDSTDQAPGIVENLDALRSTSQRRSRA